jgi:hypothetical protein
VIHTAVLRLHALYEGTTEVVPSYKARAQPHCCVSGDYVCFFLDLPFGF